MKKLVITADSTFDMPVSLANELDIKVVASYVILDEEIDDYPDVKKERLFDYYNSTGKLPKTAAASPDDYVDFFKKYLDEDTEIVHIAKSSKMSCCYDNAVKASQTLGNIYVVDSKSICGGSSLLAIMACKHRDLSAKELATYLEGLTSKIHGSFVIESLEYLAKGGRCSTVALLGANILRIRPQISIGLDGAMAVSDKFKVKYDMCITTYIDKIFKSIEKYDNETVIIGHTLLDENLLNKSVDYIKSKNYFKNVIIQEAGSAVSCHCGPNTFGMFVIEKNNEN